MRKALQILVLGQGAIEHTNLALPHSMLLSVFVSEAFSAYRPANLKTEARQTFSGTAFILENTRCELLPTFKAGEAHPYFFELRIRLKDLKALRAFLSVCAKSRSGLMFTGGVENSKKKSKKAYISGILFSKAAKPD